MVKARLNLYYFNRNGIVKIGLLIWLSIFLLVGSAACINEELSESERVSESVPDVSGDIQSENWQSGWQKTNVRNVETLIGQRLPLPTYLPTNYVMREVYCTQDLNSIPQVTHVLILFSDKPVEWIGIEYRCKLVLEIGWNEFGGGFKWLQGERISILPSGVLQETATEWILWWENFSSDEGRSVYRLRASREFARNELISIATSVPTTSVSKSSLLPPQQSGQRLPALRAMPGAP
ncbi:MAG: hypothetical protein R6U89_10665 [Dehalococcoidia bacterium]